MASSKKSSPVSEPSAEAWEMFRKMEQNYKIDKAIEKVTGYPMRCDGVCFSLQYRAWMGHLAFQVA
jgi:hypothetical protein